MYDCDYIYLVRFNMVNNAVGAFNNFSDLLEVVFRDSAA